MLNLFSSWNRREVSMMNSHSGVIIGLDMLIIEDLYLMIQSYSINFQYSSLTDVLLCNSPVLHLRTVFDYLMCMSYLQHSWIRSVKRNTVKFTVYQIYHEGGENALQRIMIMLLEFSSCSLISTSFFISSIQVSSFLGGFNDFLLCTTPCKIQLHTSAEYRFCASIFLTYASASLSVIPPFSWTTFSTMLCTSRAMFLASLDTKVENKL